MLVKLAITIMPMPLVSKKRAQVFEDTHLLLASHVCCALEVAPAVEMPEVALISGWSCRLLGLRVKPEP